MRCCKCTYNSLCGGSDFLMECESYSPVPVCICGCTMDEVTIGKNSDNGKEVILFVCSECSGQVEVYI